MAAALALLPLFAGLSKAAPSRRDESALVKRSIDTFPQCWDDTESKCDLLIVNLSSLFLTVDYNIATS